MSKNLAIFAFPMISIWIGCLERPLAPNPPPDKGSDSQGVAIHIVKDSAVFAVGSMDDLDYQKSLILDSTNLGPPQNSRNALSSRRARIS